MIVILIEMSAVCLVRTTMIIVMIWKLKITKKSLAVAIGDDNVEDVVFSDNDLAVMKEKERILREKKDKSIIIVSC